MQKYTELPPDFKPTAQEQALLDLYTTVKTYEREAAKLRENAAKAKLAKANERYQQEMEKKNKGTAGVTGDCSAVEASEGKKKNKNKKRKTKKNRQGLMGFDDEMKENELSSGSEDEEDSSEDDEDDDELKEKAAAHDFKRSAADAELEERLREEQLKSGGDDMMESGVSIKRKRDDDFGAPKKSLLSSMERPEATPPHDFSKSWGMSRVKGKVKFPPAHEAVDIGWSPPEDAQDPNEGCLEIELDNFDSMLIQNGQGNNTIGIKFTVPPESKRFSINIAGPDHEDYNEVLFHFNPRRRQKGGQIVLNDKQDGMWGQSVNVPLARVPTIFGVPSSTLIIQINSDAIEVFLERKHLARMEHRTPLPSKKCSLYLQFPSTDDYGSLENWTVYRVWWGHKDVMNSHGHGFPVVAPPGVAPGGNSFKPLHPKKLFISGLSKVVTETDVDFRRAELERAFRKYGGSLGAVVTVPTNVAFAFVELESERQADLALAEMQSQYRLSRARRTKQEIIQEERTAKEAAAAKQAAEHEDEWD